MEEEVHKILFCILGTYESSEGLVNKEAVLPHEYINNLQDPVLFF